jgi:hypothetical protein
MWSITASRRLPLAVREPPQAGFLFAAYDERDPLGDLGVEPVRAMVDGELLVPIGGGDVGVTCSAPQASAAWIEGAFRGLSILLRERTALSPSRPRSMPRPHKQN